MDRRVLIIFLVLVLVLGGILLFRAFKDPCLAPELRFEPETPVASDSVTFMCSNQEDKEVVWVIDGLDTLRGSAVKYLFDSAGTYSIEAFTEEDCFQRLDLSVGPSNRVDTFIPDIEIPAPLFSGEPVEFKGLTADGTWTWKILETGEQKTGNPFEVAFSRPGNYSVVVEVSGRQKWGIDTLKLKVKKKSPARLPASDRETFRQPMPKPQPLPVPKPLPTPPVPASKYMTDTEFIAEFIRLSNILWDDNHPEAYSLWEKNIASQGVNGSMKLHLAEGKIPREKTLESFRNDQLILSEPWKVLVVDMITRNDNGAIAEVWLKVERTAP